MDTLITALQEVARRRGASNPNWLLIPVLAGAAALGWASYHAMTRCDVRKHRLGLVAAAIVLAIPGVLYTLYYAHLYDGWRGFYELRAARGSERLAASFGSLAGIVAFFCRKWRISIGLIVILATGWLALPHSKLILLPARVQPTNEIEDGVCMQSSPSSCGPAAAVTLLGADISEAELARESYTYLGGTEIWYLMRALRARGRDVEIIMNSDTIHAPAIAGVRVQNAGHFVAVISADEDTVVVGDPLKGRFEMSPAAMRSQYNFTGFYLLVR